MNTKLVVRSLAVVLGLLAIAMGACLLFASLLPTHEARITHLPHPSPGGWSLALAITAGCSGLFFYIGRDAKHHLLLRKDAVGIVGLTWFVSSLFAALPYLFCEPSLPFHKALFEAVSGLTTTGATVFPNLEYLPKSILLWRSLTQWLGGMGILAMFVVILSGLGAGGMSLFRTESSAHGSDLAGSTLRQTVRSLWILYVTLTVVCALGMWALGMSPFQAVNHAMTTTSTGGFGTENASFHHPGFGIALKLWTTLFMFACGISFPIYIALFRKKRVDVIEQHEETKTYVVLLLIVALVVAIYRFVAGNLTASWEEELVITLFNVVSIATTTGYVVGDYDLWPVPAKGLILMLMVVGGCAGSTAGGLKVSRFILWFRMARIEIGRAYRPKRVVALELNGYPVPEGTRGQLFVILTTATALTAVGSYLLAAFEPDKSVDGCVSAVVSCLSNVGPAFNEFGPTKNFSDLSVPGTLLLPILMILGRLEYIAVLALFSRNLWRRY